MWGRWPPADLMALYDVEMDFSARKLNFFSKDHCPGHVLYWNPAAIAIVPVSLRTATGDSSRTGYRSYVDRAAHVWVPVTLDGKNFQAMLDTGLAALDHERAHRQVHLRRGCRFARIGAQGSVDGDPAHAIFAHTFATLTFDAVTVTNPHFTVIPDLVGSKDPNNSSRTDSRVRKIDDNIGGEITIGMDVLRKLHLYIAFREGKLYISPASAPVPVQADAAFTSAPPRRIRTNGPGLDPEAVSRHRNAMTRDPQKILGSLLDAARKAGADAADALYVEGVSSSVSYRLGKLEDVERAENYDLGLRVFVGRKVAFVSSTDFSARRWTVCRNAP